MLVYGFETYMLNPSGVAFESADYPRIEASDVNPPRIGTGSDA